jgi:uncharacterized protein
MRIPVALLTALVAQVVGQTAKFVLYSVRDGRISPHYLVSAGGVPSAHTAFVTALTAYIGLTSGVVSDLFAVAAVFSAIVIYDAFRLRGHVQRHAELLNRHVLLPNGEPPVSEMVGHSLPEIAAGLAVGGAMAGLAALLVG